MAHGDDPKNDDVEVREPDNSTVDDWLGQDVARDEDVADKAVRETDSMEEAEEQFNREADGQETHEQAYPRPGEEPPGGPSPA